VAGSRRSDEGSVGSYACDQRNLDNEAEKAMNSSLWKRPALVVLVLVALVMTMAMPASGAPTRVSHPSAPLTVHASGGRGEARVSWSRPASNGGSPITTYVATSHPQNKRCVTVSTTCTISKLRNGTLYTFTVVARNKVGAGSSSRPSNRVRTTIVTPTKGAKTSWWKPGPGVLPWQWEIDHALNLGDATDMGTNDTLPNGQPAPAPKVYDIDGILNPASTVAALHARGAHAICYIEVGSAGNYYSTAQEGIASTYYAQYQAAGVLGNALSGYPEHFLNINSPATVRITEAMIAQQCAAKGFDAVETDLDETYSGSDGASGFSLTQGDEVAYMTKLADYMHRLGLGWVIKNPDDTGDNYATLMEPLADAVLTEQCNEYSTCSALSAYLGHKAIFNAEYNLSTASFCPSDIAAGINGALFPVALNGTRSPCQ
jgi:hypothetical protein